MSRLPLAEKTIPLSKLPSYRRMAALRGRIDKIDESIVRLLADRCRLAQDIGDEKKTMDLPVLNRKREKKILERVAVLASDQGLDSAMARLIFSDIIRLGRAQQK